MTNSDFEYAGKELFLFQEATHWKHYFVSKIRPFIRGKVLEVGAGIGSSTLTFLQSGTKFDSWTCLEPDPMLCNKIPADKFRSIYSGEILTKDTFLTDLPAQDTYDTILYIDVLEHIEDDKHEIQMAASHLQPSGRLIVLAPAHNRLFSEFDRSIGHFRRYNKSSLLQLFAENFQMEAAFYLDSLGLAASLMNSLVLKQSMPTKRQILFWDKILVSGSRWLDPLTGYLLGKSIVAVMKKTLSN